MTGTIRTPFVFQRSKCCCLFISFSFYYHNLGDGCGMIIKHSGGVYNPCVSHSNESVVTKKNAPIVTRGRRFITVKRDTTCRFSNGSCFVTRNCDQTRSNRDGLFVHRVA